MKNVRIKSFEVKCSFNFALQAHILFLKLVSPLFIEHNLKNRQIYVQTDNYLYINQR